MAQLKITQTRGLVGTKRNQRESMRTLGLRKIRQTVVRPDDANTRGLVRVVHHLVTVEEVD
ncbi:50S ribosomal protein L30 [Saccharopolyspora sp. MS10]|uniref:50S ribosomal protein L30 n=1 Tax=Saccharopolyspora sp. MS10 TaxID=3385973 RepID=UPI0039A1903D